MRRISILAVTLALACQACQPPPDATLAGPIPGQPQPPACSSYTVPLTVGGQPQQAVVEACSQADGSWRITQTTPGLPPQVYEVPAAVSPPSSSGYSYPEASAYPDFGPSWGWSGWGGAPWFFGLAPSIVVVPRFNHFHHGFHHGFAHGFGHGGRGFGGRGWGGRGFGGRGFGGHGFAGMHSGGMGGGHR
jgi:hypothetical protein